MLRARALTLWDQLPGKRQAEPPQSVLDSAGQAAQISPVMSEEHEGHEAEGRMMPGQILLGCRERLGAPPRRFSWWQRRKLRGRVPSWMTIYDELWPVVEAQQVFLERGDVVWGALVQANDLLFSPGRLDCPAEVCYCPDPDRFHNEVGRLREAASALFELKGTRPANAELARAAREVTDEVARWSRRPVPEAVAGMEGLCHATVLVWRRHLPGGILALPLFPLLVADDVPFAMILPDVFWPEAFRQYWQFVARAARSR